MPEYEAPPGPPLEKTTLKPGQKDPEVPKSGRPEASKAINRVKKGTQNFRYSVERYGPPAVVVTVAVCCVLGALGERVGIYRAIIDALSQSQRSSLDALSDSEARKIMELGQAARDQMTPADQGKYDAAVNLFAGSYDLARVHFTPGQGESKNLDYWRDQIGPKGKTYSQDEIIAGTALASALQSLGITGRSCNVDALSKKIADFDKFDPAKAQQFARAYDKFCRYGSSHQDWGGLFFDASQKQESFHNFPAEQQAARKRLSADVLRSKAEYRSVRRPMGRRS